MPPSAAHRVRAALPDRFTTLLFCGTAALFAVVSPLVAHTMALGLLVVPHLILALRYDRDWLAPHTTPGLRWTALVAVLCIGALRFAAHQEALDPTVATVGEIALVVGMIVPALPLVLPRLGALGGLLTGALAALALAVVAVPESALLIAESGLWLVPVLLLLQRLPPGRRGGLLSGGLFTFVAVPLLIAGGMPTSLAVDTQTSWPDSAPVELGPLAVHLQRVFPPALADHARGPDLFRARVYLEYLHCGVVLAILPALPRAPSAPRALRPALVAAGAAGLTGVAAAGLFSAPVLTARILETAAVLQGWLELPLLLGATAALAAGRASR